MSWAEHGIVVHTARSAKLAALRGALGRCPNCGVGQLFDGYLRVVDRCASCSEELHHHRADDAPPYFTILVVGHIVVGLVMSVEVLWSPPIWVHLLLWLPLTLGLALGLLRPIKGIIVGMQWAFRMHGFGDEGAEEPRDGGMSPGHHS
jgi:uncharacterized protein (DUF983 family)